MVTSELTGADRYKTYGPDENGEYTAWDHDQGEYLEDRGGQTRFKTYEEAHDLVMEHRG